MAYSLEQQLQEAKHEISELQRQLLVYKNDFTRITSMQVGKINSLVKENHSLEDVNESLQQKLNEQQERYNSLLTEGTMARVGYPQIEKPYIRKEFSSPVGFICLLDTIRDILHDHVPYVERDMLLWPNNTLNINKNTTEILEKAFYKLVVGLSFNPNTSVGIMRMLHKDTLKNGTLVLVPQNRDDMESSLKIGDRVSAIPNPELFGNRHFIYTLPKKLMSQISPVYEIEGVRHSEGNLSYKISEYPLLRYQGNASWQVCKKGRIEFLSTDEEVKIEY